MFELADMKIVRRRLRDQLFKARQLLKKAEKRIKTSPTAFRTYASEVIEYNERIHVLVEVFKATRAPGNNVDAIFGFALQRIIYGSESRNPDIPANQAWALVTQLLKKNSIYA